MARNRKTAEPLDSAKALSAMLALLIADREERLAAADNSGRGARKTELILAASGLTASEIAPLVGKNFDAVRKTIQRGAK